MDEIKRDRDDIFFDLAMLVIFCATIAVVILFGIARSSADYRICLEKNPAQYCGINQK